MPESDRRLGRGSAQPAPAQKPEGLSPEAVRSIYHGAFYWYATEVVLAGHAPSMVPIPLI